MKKTTIKCKRTNPLMWDFIKIGDPFMIGLGQRGKVVGKEWIRPGKSFNVLVEPNHVTQ